MHIKYIKKNGYKNIFFLFFFNTLNTLTGKPDENSLAKKMPFFPMRIFFDKTAFHFH